MTPLPGAAPPPAAGVVILAGPTAVGKSALALALARRTGGEIVAVDSMQVYRGLDVGTGKPLPEERAAVPHHLLDCCEAHQRFSAGEFARRAHRLVGEIRGRGRLPILVGGTGLYLRAFLRGSLSGGGADPGIRERLAAEAERLGPGALFDRLAGLDPDSAARIHPGDRVRILRALELWETTGQAPSTLRPGLWGPPTVPVADFLVLTRDREELYQLIDRRCGRMWGDGLLAETGRLLALAAAGPVPPLGALGYRQAAAYLRGELSQAAALAEMQRTTRNFAKRQLTWFRREAGARWLRVAGWDWVEPTAAALAERLADPAGARRDLTRRGDG